MAFSVLLYISLAIFLAGLIYRVSTWFTRKIGISAGDIKTSERITSAAGGILGVVFSSRILTAIKVFVLDGLLQIRILKEDGLRWAMHMLIYGGFMLLLLMHALGSLITSALFSDYYSTVNPFFFLRDLFGVMVIAGMLIAIYRRVFMKPPRPKTNAMDVYAIVILAVIMLSGLSLEAVKITSHTDFTRMVEEYAGLDDEEEIQALESYWVKDWGLVSPNVEGPFDEELLETGREIHETNCMDCHSPSQYAFASYGISRIIKPAAISIDQAGGAGFLWWVHILACFAGLAYLPFSKMFHIIATPICLVVNAVMEEGKSNPANVATRQALELDACTHCGSCTLRCSSAPAFDALGNPFILPSEKMVFLKKLASGKDLEEKEIQAIQEGVYLCTNCDRCTVVCPSGITLKDLWVDVREALIQRGHPEPLVLSPYSFFRGLNRKKFSGSNYGNPLESAQKAVAGNFESIRNQSGPIAITPDNNGNGATLPEPSTYTYCFACQNCTNVCPVADSHDDPEESLGLLPHQIMCSLGLGLIEMASGARMIWDCVTCYQCQEHCPQKVKVTDILYQLKNLAARQVDKPDSSTAPKG